MNRVLVLGVLLTSLSCGRSAEQKARENAKQNLDTISQALNEAEVKQEEAILRIAQDPEGELFPYAEAAVIESMRDDLGETIDENVKAHALMVEPLDNDKWEVQGEYHGRDTDGKSFRREWTIEIHLFLGRLQTKSVSHSEKFYE